MAPSDTAPAALRHDSIKGAYELCVSPRLNQLFVAATPSFGEGDPGFLHVFDADSLQPIRQIQLPRRAFALALDDQAGRLYVGHTIDGALSVVDIASGSVISSLQLGQPGPEGRPEHTRMIRLDPARALALVTSPSDPGLIWIADLATGTLRHRIEAGLWRTGAAYDAARGIFWTSGGGIEEINGWDAETGTKVAALSTGDTTEDGKTTSKHFFVNLALDAAGQRLFAADSMTGAIYAFDIASGSLIGRTEVGLGALDVAFNPIRDEVYVTWRGDSRDAPGGTGGLAILNAGDLSLRHNMDLPPHPNSIEVSADGQTLWMTVKQPYSDSHPAWRKEALDSVIRLDLSQPTSAQ